MYSTCETESVLIADTINSWSLCVYNHLIPTSQYLKYKTEYTQHVDALSMYNIIIIMY